MKNEVIRKCLGCGALKDRKSMIKICLSENSIFIEPNSKITGRSVYVCKNEDCINMLIKKKRIKKGLKFNNDAKIKEAENKLTTLLN